MEKSQKDKFAELAQMLRSVDTDSFTIMAQNLKVLLIILDQDLKLQYGNDVFFEMVGWQPEKVIGQDYVHNFIPPEISFVVRTTLREIINKQVNNYSGSNLVLTRQNGPRYVNWNSVHLCSADGSTCSMLCIGIDITENNSLTEILRRAALEKELIVDNIEELVFFGDQNGCILEGNLALGDFLDTKLEMVVGTFCYKLLHNLSRPCVHCPLPNLLASGKSQVIATTLSDGSTWQEKIFLLKEDGVHSRKILVVMTATEAEIPKQEQPKNTSGGLKKIQGYNEIGIFSTAMQNVMNQAEILHGDRSVPVLIEGETGTGKELVARFIHFGSQDCHTPFIDINCAAITPTIFESELFGYEGGAFTGGRSGGQKGKLDLAQGGTLFLDEIGEIPVSIQAKLLRVIQEKEYFRVGGLKKQEVDVRLICATNVELEKNILAGTFRKDLFYRLEAVRIHIPALRERPSDILPLAEIFLKTLTTKKGKRFRGISGEAAQIFLSHSWPGNIRQLKNTMERVVLMWDDTEVRPEHLTFLQKPEEETGGTILVDLPAETLDLQKLTNHIIRQALAKHNGNKTATARYLNISRRVLTYRLGQLESI